MIFKERRFHQTDPSDEALRAGDLSFQADLEARIADFLSSLSDITVSDMSVVVGEGRAILGGFAGSAEERLRAEAAINHAFPGVPVDNRLQIS